MDRSEAGACYNARVTEYESDRLAPIDIPIGAVERVKQRGTDPYGDNIVWRVSIDDVYLRLPESSRVLFPKAENHVYLKLICESGYGDRNVAFFGRHQINSERDWRVGILAKNPYRPTKINLREGYLRFQLVETDPAGVEEKPIKPDDECEYELRFKLVIRASRRR